MKGQLFVAIAVENPVIKKGEDEDQISKIIFGPEVIIAKDEKTAAIKVIRDDRLKDADLDRLEVVMRPF